MWLMKVCVLVETPYGSETTCCDTVGVLGSSVDLLDPITAVETWDLHT